MANVKVVTAYVPLDVKHLSRDEYKDLGAQLKEACGGRIHAFENYPLKDCWAYRFCDYPPAAPVPADRYGTPEANVRSHVVQHNRTAWAIGAVAADPDVDVWVWLDYGILKQGRWNGNPVTQDHISAFLDRLERAKPWGCVPFPGIAQPGPVDPFGNNWRFCGSTHIWPTRYLPHIHGAYIRELYRFVGAFGKVPLDLAIWPLVEKFSGLPFRWYQAEYDATQLTNFPGDL